MQRNFRTEKDKEIRRLYKEYSDTWQQSRTRGQFVEVEPYQAGWYRHYVLREDIARRDDARFYRQALDLVNTNVICNREDFLVRSWKKKEGFKPIKQELKSLNDLEFERLNPNLNKLFARVQKWNTWSKLTYFVYEVSRPTYYVFEVEPNIVTHHWLPDPEWETYTTELSHRIERNNLWPKINHLLGVPNNYDRDYTWNKGKRMNKYGEFLTTEYDPDLELKEEKLRAMVEAEYNERP